MVLHSNVNVGQRVEVLQGGSIYRGIVRYKGCIATRKGDWVGVEFDFPVGDNCGMVRGRSYFQCRDNHGKFVRSNKIRFIPSGRCLFNRYFRVLDDEPVDETLFKTPRPAVKNGPYDPVELSPERYSRVRSSLDFNIDQVWPAYCVQQSQNYPLRHSVGNRLPAATMLRPQTARNPFQYTSRPIHTEYRVDEDFIASPSIPKTHMPYLALRKQVRRGWDDSHYVREMSVGTGREKMKFSQWNDVSG
ncbi:uncharacterized protein LOC121373387 [Gigantopelta aegis]|uniref:uncharacterized protein LOC121373387 n=1 Tax=Gigantopelta aegis TaxID=1735272 RepID=UPI001B887B12|nr:uncharacterized protein LOC121373387 [Gigantopelta aegis]